MINIGLHLPYILKPTLPNMNTSADKIKKILIARTENRIGDIILTLPLAGILKSHFPAMQVALLGTRYSEPIAKKSTFIDTFYNWNRFKDLSQCNADAVMLVSPYFDIAKAAWQAKIPVRIGTARRWFHWFYTNRRVFLKHRPVNLHETQLSTSFLSALGIKESFNIDTLYRYYGWQKEPKRPFPDVISDNKYNVILHPKSKGSAPQWPLQHYRELADMLDGQRFNVIISGSKEEKDSMQQDCPQLFELPHVTNITGRYELADFIGIVEQADCLVANSTGPLHLAAAAGINTVGLYAPVRPQHPGRWKPIGRRVTVLCHGQLTNDKKYIDKIAAITPHEVKKTVEEMLKK